MLRSRQYRTDGQCDRDASHRYGVATVRVYATTRYYAAQILLKVGLIQPKNRPQILAFQGELRVQQKPQTRGAPVGPNATDIGWWCRLT